MLNVSFGMEEKIWRPIFDNLHKNQGLNAREAILKIYVDNLMKMYSKPPIITEIYDTTQRAIVYCLILCTDSDAGHYVMKLKGIPHYEKWQYYTWGDTAKRIVAGRKLSPDQSSLFDFSKPSNPS
jgi:hypothetical protein